MKLSFVSPDPCPMQIRCPVLFSAMFIAMRLRRGSLVGVLLAVCRIVFDRQSTCRERLFLKFARIAGAKAGRCGSASRGVVKETSAVSIYGTSSQAARVEFWARSHTQGLDKTHGAITSWRHKSRPSRAAGLRQTDKDMIHDREGRWFDYCHQGSERDFDAFNPLNRTLRGHRNCHQTPSGHLLMRHSSAYPRPSSHADKDAIGAKPDSACPPLPSHLASPSSPLPNRATMLPFSMTKRYVYALLAGIALVVLLAGNYAYHDDLSRREFPSSRPPRSVEADLLHSSRLSATVGHIHDPPRHGNQLRNQLILSHQDLAELERRLRGPDRSNRRLPPSVARCQSGLAL